MDQVRHQFARDYFAKFYSGKLTADLYTPDLQVWGTTVEKQAMPTYPVVVNTIMSLFKGGKLDHTIKGITSEDDRLVVEAEASGVFLDGEPYSNAYAFVLRLRDGLIYDVAEHFNPLPATEKLFPRLAALSAQ